MIRAGLRAVGGFWAVVGLVVGSYMTFGLLSSWLGGAAAAAVALSLLVFALGADYHRCQELRGRR